MSYELCATNPQKSERWIRVCSNVQELKAVLGRTPLSPALIESVARKPGSPVRSFGGGELMFSGADIKHMGLEREKLESHGETAPCQKIS
jgi:hypothetical protein